MKKMLKILMCGLLVFSSQNSYCFDLKNLITILKSTLSPTSYSKGTNGLIVIAGITAVGLLIRKLKSNHPKDTFDTTEHIHKESNNGQITLHTAARYDNLEIVEYLIENGANIEAKDDYGNTPLHTAANYGSTLEIVEYLIENGADIEANNNDGNTPLHHAAENGNLEIVEYLIENGTNIEAKGDYSYTPLHLAARYGKPEIDLKIVEYLIENGADIEAENKAGDTPLHLAAGYGNLEIVKYLIENGADIETKNKAGDTPLHLAAQNGRTKTVKLLKIALELDSLLKKLKNEESKNKQILESIKTKIVSNKETPSCVKIKAVNELVKFAREKERYPKIVKDIIYKYPTEKTISFMFETCASNEDFDRLLEIANEIGNKKIIRKTLSMLCKKSLFIDTKKEFVNYLPKTAESIKDKKAERETLKMISVKNKVLPYLPPEIVGKIMSYV